MRTTTSCRHSGRLARATTRTACSIYFLRQDVDRTDYDDDTERAMEARQITHASAPGVAASTPNVTGDAPTTLCNGPLQWQDYVIVYRGEVFNCVFYVCHEEGPTTGDGATELDPSAPNDDGLRAASPGALSGADNGGTGDADGGGTADAGPGAR
jgi:hypothetical protein